jgi:hypothetical protein
VSSKVALAVRSDLATWQKLNVAAFLTSGLGSVRPEVIGEHYVDASGREYPPMLAMPVRVFGGDLVALQRSFARVVDRQLLVSVYIDEMFDTMNDADNRSAIAAVPTAALAIAGFVAVGDAKQIDKAFDKLRAHD